VSPGEPQTNSPEDDAGELRARAEQGDADAQYCMAMKYHHGLGLPNDDVQAVLWYCRAAENEHPDALFALGCMYVLGRGVPEDYVEAYTWISLGAVRACGPDKKLYTQVRKALAECMTRRQLTEARTLARLWAEAFEKRTTGRSTSSPLEPLIVSHQVRSSAMPPHWR